MAYTPKVGASNIVDGCISPEKIDILRNDQTLAWRYTFGNAKDGSEWTDEGGGTPHFTTANDTTNTLTPGIDGKDNGFRVTCNNVGSQNHYIYRSYASDQNFSGSGKQLVVTFYVPEGSGDSAYTTMNAIYL